MAETLRTKKRAGHRKTTRSRTKSRATNRRKRRVAADQKLSKLRVRRTSGRTESYDKEKMARTIGRSGTPFAMARDIAKSVSKKIAKDMPKGRVHAKRVRRLVAEELAARNRPDIAASYKGERPENTRQERYGLERKNQPVDDGTAGSLSRLTSDKSTRFARSTKIHNS